MSLRRKLLLVALCTLILPLAGWVYVRQMETLLREGQAQALVAAARAVARGLAVSGAALPAVDADHPGWYVQRMVTPLTIDGYGDDWAPLTPWSQPVGPRGQLLLGDDGAGLAMLLDVRAAQRTRADVDDPAVLRSDHVLLSLVRGQAQQRYLLASSAPGASTARSLDPPADGLPESLAAQWQEDGSGYRIELRLPPISALGVGIYTAADGDDAAVAPVRALLALSGDVSSELAKLAPDEARARVLSPGGWLLAQSAPRRAGDADAPRPGWLASMVYRSLLAARVAPAEPWAEHAPRLPLPEVQQASLGHSATQWREGESRASVVLSAAVPIERDGQLRGVLLLEQVSRAVPLLANRALAALLITSFAVLLLAGGVLLAFAARLSFRLRRLRDATEKVQAADGRLDGLFPHGFPMHDAPDEVGDLARSFERLFDAVGGYTDYLRTLASKLSHELNTPLAIVKSSLDNLEHALPGDTLPAQARPYLARARDGVARLGTLVRSMSEASRMERAMAAAEPEDVDLRAIVRGCAEAYRPLAGARALACHVPDAPLPLHVAPELIAQALDKLLDNALSFTPVDGWLRLTLRALPDGAQIELANQGPLLPPELPGRLFDSLVSLRNRATPGEAPHLGLGLYVVRLVAERHGGTAAARNLDDGSGVAFVLTLRGMPRQRLGD